MHVPPSTTNHTMMHIKYQNVNGSAYLDNEDIREISKHICTSTRDTEIYHKAGVTAIKQPKHAD